MAEPPGVTFGEAIVGWLGDAELVESGGKVLRYAEDEGAAAIDGDVPALGAFDAWALGVCTCAVTDDTVTEPDGAGAVFGVLLVPFIIEQETNAKRPVVRAMMTCEITLLQTGSRQVSRTQLIYDRIIGQSTRCGKPPCPWQSASTRPAPMQKKEKTLRL